MTERHLQSLILKSLRPSDSEGCPRQPQIQQAVLHVRRWALENGLQLSARL